MKSLLLALYPSAWRDRYGDELSALLEETGLTTSIVADIVRGALRERGRAVRRRLQEEHMRVDLAHRHPTAFGLVAVLIAVPTTVLVLGSIIGHELGIAAIASLTDPLAVAVGAWRPLDLFLVAAPALAVVIATLPLLEVGLRRADGSSLATVAIRLRWLNLAVAIAALALGLLLVAHIVSESILEAGR